MNCLPCVTPTKKKSLLNRENCQKIQNKQNRPTCGLGKSLRLWKYIQLSKSSQQWQNVTNVGGNLSITAQGLTVTYRQPHQLVEVYLCVAWWNKGTECWRTCLLQAFDLLLEGGRLTAHHETVLGTTTAAQYRIGKATNSSAALASEAPVESPPSTSSICFSQYYATFNSRPSLGLPFCTNRIQFEEWIGAHRQLNSESIFPPSEDESSLKTCRVKTAEQI